MLRKFWVKLFLKLLKSLFLGSGRADGVVQWWVKLKHLKWYPHPMASVGMYGSVIKWLFVSSAFAINQFVFLCTFIALFNWANFLRFYVPLSLEALISLFQIFPR